MKHAVKILLMAAALLAAASPASAVQKCTGPDGKVTFQDVPCANGRSEVLHLPSSAGQGPDGAATAQAQSRVEKLKRDNEMAEAIRTHKPLVGMSVAQLQDAMGPATKVNADNYNGTQREQVIFERPAETWYVYTRDGVVDSIQYRPGAPLASAPAAASVRCPTPFEIKNAITSASSITLSERERTARWQAIRAMQTCGRQ